VSEDLEQIVRDSYAAYNRGDLEGAAQSMHPEVEWDSGEISLTGQALRGQEAVIAQLRPDIFENQRTEILQLEVNDRQVYVELRFSAVGTGSGMKLVTPGWQVWTFEQGLAVRVQNFLDREEARAAAGLEPSRAD
jgi:ketosteroid isomerase-like protein